MYACMCVCVCVRVRAYVCVYERSFSVRLCFQERESFSVMSFFQNPMMLMMLVSVFLMVVMPKMLPEEVVKEMEEHQAQMGSNPMDMLKKVMSGEAMDGGEEEEDDDSRRTAVTRRPKKRNN